MFVAVYWWRVHPGKEEQVRFRGRARSYCQIAIIKKAGHVESAENQSSE